jgi:hypothetical protein
MKGEERREREKSKIKEVKESGGEKNSYEGRREGLRK